MTEYSIIRAPGFYDDVDAMRIWLNCQSAIGQDLLCAYSDRRGRAVFVFQLQLEKSREDETRDKEEYLRDCPTCQETGRGLTNEKAEG